MNVELLVISIFHIISAVVTLSFGFFVWFKKFSSMKNIIFLLLAISIASFNIVFLIASNIADLDLAWKAWMFNASDVFIAIFAAHFYLVYVMDEGDKYKIPLRIVYAYGTILLTAILLFPRSFLPYVEPKLYFESYLVPGPLYIYMIILFIGVGSYIIFETVKKYFRLPSGVEKRKLEYFIIAPLYAYITGSTAFILVYDIPVDPILSPLNSLFIVIVAYGVIKQQVLDIRIVIKRAFIYSILITVASAFLVVITLLNQWFVTIVPELPLWIVPVVAAFGSVLIGRLFWNKSQESDLLKYEFITIAAHKLRTPLTEMKWEIENVLLQKPTSEVESAVRRLRNTNDRLIMLSDALVESSEADDEDYSYNYSPTQLKLLADEVIEQFEDIISEKDLSVTFELDENIPTVKVDTDRIKSVVRVMIENAIIYTQPMGKVLIQIGHRDGKVIFSVADNGIGVKSKEKPHIFTKFYRSAAAKTSDTEGIGIGLYISKSIIERHNGEIGFSSDGSNMGSKFWFSLNV